MRGDEEYMRGGSPRPGLRPPVTRLSPGLSLDASVGVQSLAPASSCVPSERPAVASATPSPGLRPGPRMLSLEEVI